MTDPAIDAERVRPARHEASHAIVAALLNWRVKCVRIGAEHGGMVDLWPDCPRRADYRNPAVAPLLLFLLLLASLLLMIWLLKSLLLLASLLLLLADAEAFNGGDYDGPPLPVPLPPGGLRVVADIVAVLLAGFASEADTVGNYRRALAIEGSDACQIECLTRQYTAANSIRDNLLQWLPGFLTDEMAEPVNAIAAVLLHPTDTALASSLGAEDVDSVLGGIDEQRMAKARRRLNAQLDGLVLLASAASRAA